MLIKKLFIASYLIIFIFWDSQRLGLILRHVDLTMSPQKQGPTACLTVEILIDRIQKSGTYLLTTLRSLKIRF
jgi:hypothetical protein